MKKITALLICMVIALLGVFSASAAPAPLKPGYVTDDTDVNIKDATMVQKYLADLCELRKEQEYCADVDNDGKVTIKDATMIQKYVAGIVSEFDKEPGYIKVYVDTVYADFDSTMAMAGVPVTFTAQAEGYMAPFSYEFIVDNTVVAERSQNNTFTYTFSEAGEYFVTVRVYNSFDVVSERTALYEVTEPYDSETPVIKALYFDKNYFVGEYNQVMNSADENVTITAEAIMGSGEYEYCFLIDGEIVQDFSANNKYVMTEVPDRTTCEITVYVRDFGTTDNYASKTMSVQCGVVVG